MVESILYDFGDGRPSYQPLIWIMVTLRSKLISSCLQTTPLRNSGWRCTSGSRQSLSCPKWQLPGLWRRTWGGCNSGLTCENGTKSDSWTVPVLPTGPSWPSAHTSNGIWEQEAGTLSVEMLLAMRNPLFTWQRHSPR